MTDGDVEVCEDAGDEGASLLPDQSVMPVETSEAVASEVVQPEGTGGEETESPDFAPGTEPPSHSTDGTLPADSSGRPPVPALLALRLVVCLLARL